MQRREHGHFNVIHHESAMRADVYLAGDDPFHSWALDHRVARTIEGTPVQFAPIEYVIVYKLLYFRMGGSDRHLRDIARMLRISATEIDLAVIERWIDRYRLDTEWDRARGAGED
ncbi:MAG: hypothetical protein IT361_06780 [Gemmatimonadaceae bacterium]|nr:hypothetical protein [Gemmatimonadaceae bacterium]